MNWREKRNTGRGCQWIESDPKIDATMCGEPVEYGKPYCLQHCTRAYQNYRVCEPVEQAAE